MTNGHGGAQIGGILFYKTTIQQLRSHLFFSKVQIVFLHVLYSYY